MKVERLLSVYYFILSPSPYDYNKTNKYKTVLLTIATAVFILKF